MEEGLVNQELGELTPTTTKILQLHRRRLHPSVSEPEPRVVFATGERLHRDAFECAVDLAGRAHALIEVLFVRPESRPGADLPDVLPRLAASGRDFQITYRKGDLVETIACFGRQRQDILALVCGDSGRLEGYRERFGCSDDPALSKLVMLREIHHR